MHLVVFHDAEGNIESVIASPPEAPVAYGSTGPGRYMTEVEMTDLDSISEPDKFNARLTDIVEHFRVEGDSMQRSLNRKQDSDGYSG